MVEFIRTRGDGRVLELLNRTHGSVLVLVQFNSDGIPMDDDNNDQPIAPPEGERFPVLDTNYM